MRSGVQNNKQEAYHAFIFAEDELPPLAGRQLTNNDLQLTTDGEGSQQLIKTFRALFGMTAVRVRYRFITSEIPGDCFGSMFHDFFSISIRSQIEVRISVANVGDGLFDSSVIVDFVAELGCNLGSEITTTIPAGPVATARAFSLAVEAKSITEDTGLPGPNDGPADGFRHCYWSCRMTQDLGVDTARDVGDLHELCGGNPEPRRLMDLFNNEVGRGFGTPGADGRSSCEQAVANGAIQTSP